MAELTFLINMANDADRALQDPRQCEEERTPEQQEPKQDDVFLSDFQNSLIESEKSCLPSNDRQCIVCSKYFVSAEAARSHFETYHDNTLFECRICRLTFMLESNLQIHHTKHHCHDHTKLKTTDHKSMSSSSSKNSGPILDQVGQDVIHKDANNVEDPEGNSQHWNCINDKKSTESTTPAEQTSQDSHVTKDADDEKPKKVETDEGSDDLNGYYPSNTSKHLVSGTQESERCISIDLSSSNSPLTYSRNMTKECEDINKENKAPIVPIGPDDRSQFTQSGTIDESSSGRNAKEDSFTDATTTIHQEEKFWCKTCNISFKKKIYLSRHSMYSLTHKQNIANPKSIVKRIPCISCDSTFAHKKSLRRHQRVTCRKRIENAMFLNSSEALSIEKINLTENYNSKQLEQVVRDDTITKQKEIDRNKESKQIETDSKTATKGNESQTISTKGIDPVIGISPETPNRTTVSNKEEAKFNVTNHHQLREITIPCIRLENVCVPIGFDYNQASGSSSVRDGDSALENCVTNSNVVEKDQEPKNKEGGSKGPTSIVVQNISNDQNKYMSDDMGKPYTSMGNIEDGSKTSELNRPNGASEGQTGIAENLPCDNNNKDRQSPDWEMILEFLHQCQESEPVHTQEQGPAFEDSFTKTPKRIRRYTPALCDGCGVTFSSKSSCKRHKVKSCKGYGNNLPRSAKSKKNLLDVLKDQSPNKGNMGSETLMGDEENSSPIVNQPFKRAENQAKSPEQGLCLLSNDPETVENQRSSSEKGTKKSPQTEQRTLAECQRPCPKSKKKFLLSNVYSPVDKSRASPENEIKQSNTPAENKSESSFCYLPCPKSKKRFVQGENSEKVIPITDENVASTRNINGVVQPCSKIKKTSFTDDEEVWVSPRTRTNLKSYLNRKKKSFAVNKETTSNGGYQKPCPKSKKKFYVDDLAEASNKPIIQTPETTNQRITVSLLSQTYQQPCAKDAKIIPHIQHECDKNSSEDITPITDTTSKTKLKTETIYQMPCPRIEKLQDNEREAPHPKIASVINKGSNFAFKPRTYQKPCPKSKKKFYVDDLKDDVLCMDGTATSCPESEKLKSIVTEKVRKDLKRIEAYPKPCPKSKKKFHLDESKSRPLKSLQTTIFKDDEDKDTKAPMMPYEKPCPKSKKKFYREIENIENERNVCPKLIRENLSLVSGEHGHMPKLRITCNVCGRQFPRRSQCMRHMRQVHSKRPQKFRWLESQPTPRVAMGSRNEEEESNGQSLF